MKIHENQTAIISGGLGDIGRAIARELATRGASVGIGDMASPEQASPFLEELRALGVRARYDQTDCSDDEAVRVWVNNVAVELGTPSLIIPNAAIVTLKDVRMISPAEWRRELSINLDGAFYLAQIAALRLLQEKQPGRIVFIGSWAAEAAHPHIPAYSVAKAGLRMLMKCLALDLAPHDIMVNEVAPGYVNAGLSARIFDEDAESKSQATARVPLGRLVEPQEVAIQVAHLCDPKNRHMTGSVLTMDGGLSLHSPASLDWNHE